MKKQMIAGMLALGCFLCGAANAETVKHERVFAVVDAQGEVSSLLDSVRLENGDGLEIIEDRTMLEQIENVSGLQTFSQDGEAIRWQADGESLIYQGTSDKALSVTPQVRFTLDGKEATAQEIKEAVGEVTIDVTYALDSDRPVMVASLLPIDEHLRHVTVENGTVVTDGERGFVMGWAVPGVDERAQLPEGFTVTAQADHADLTFMMTFATAQPLELLCEEMGERVAQADGAVEELTKGLMALRDGTASDEAGLEEEMTQILRLFEGITALDGGAQELATGAGTLAEGAASLQEGAASLSAGAAALDSGALALKTGLTTLVQNNETLNQGAAQLCSAILATANAQLAQAGMDKVGIILPELTMENYEQALQTAIDQLEPEQLQKTAAEAAREMVKAQVLQQEDAIRQAVAEAAGEKMLESALSSLGMAMTAQEYAAAVQEGKVTAEQAGQIERAIAEAAATEEAKAQLEAAVAQQIETLTEENFATDAVQAELKGQLDAAAAGREALMALKEQLSGVHAFVTGLGEYTQGVSQAETGAQELSTGASQLNTGAAALSSGATELSGGAAQLNTGAAQIKDGTQQLVDGLDKLKIRLTQELLPWLEGDARAAIDVFNQMSEDVNEPECYDLIPEGMAHDLLLIIRSDLSR